MAASLVSLKNGESSERSIAVWRILEQKINGSTAVPFFFFFAYARPSIINSAFSGIGDGNSNTEPRLESRSMNAFSSPQLLIAELFLRKKHNDREHARHWVQLATLSWGATRVTRWCISSINPRLNGSSDPWAHTRERVFNILYVLIE